MSKTQRAYPPGSVTLPPWVIGAFLLGILISIAMPPLLLVLDLSLAAWGLVRFGHQTPSSRRAMATAIGLAMATALYLVIWIGGNISR